MGRPDDIQLADLAVDGLVNAQVTAIVVDSDLFEPVRDMAALALPAPWCDLLTCHVCTGTWLGIFQAVLRGGPPRRFLSRAFAIACIGRLIRVLIEHPV
jgi:hypothetical protein